MKLTESTWSPFQSAEVREICAHLTPEEHACLLGDARWRGQQIGQRLAVPSGVVAGSLGWSWQLGIVLLALFIVYFAVSGLPRLRAMRRRSIELLCETEWARQARLLARPCAFDDFSVVAMKYRRPNSALQRTGCSRCSYPPAERER